MCFAEFLQRCRKGDIAVGIQPVSFLAITIDNLLQAARFLETQLLVILLMFLLFIASRLSADQVTWAVEVIRC